MYFVWWRNKTYLLTYLLIYLFTYLLTYLLTYLGKQWYAEEVFATSKKIIAETFKLATMQKLRLVLISCIYIYIFMYR